MLETNAKHSLTLFSFGAGQESTYYLHRLGCDQDFYNKQVCGELIVVGADTGDEHPHTHENITWCKEFCKQKKIRFVWITKDMGFHGKTWQSLFEQYNRTKTIGSAAFQQTCTDNLKVKVVDRFLEFWIKFKYNYSGKNKSAVKDFVNDNANKKIKYILCFAKGEENRTSKGNAYDGVWKQKTCERVYPLIELGIGREECIEYNTQNIPHIVWPSNCMRCFYQSDQEILWLYRFYPEKFTEWVQAENEKLIKWKHKELEEPPKNYGVFGLMRLDEKLAKATKLYGNWTDERLNEYKLSHGHCIKTKY